MFSGILFNYYRGILFDYYLQSQQLQATICNSCNNSSTQKKSSGTWVKITLYSYFPIFLPLLPQASNTLIFTEDNVARGERCPVTHATPYKVLYFAS